MILTSFHAFYMLILAFISAVCPSFPTTTHSINKLSAFHVNLKSLAIEVLRMVEKRKIDDIVVVDADGKVVGIVDIQDLPGLKLM